MKCLVCSGPCYGLGRLGRFRWFRCRNCGLDQHRDTQQLDEQEESDDE